MGKRKKYSAEFKAEVLELLAQPDQTVAGVARDLELSASMVNRWRKERRELGRQAFVGQGVSRDEEMTRLKREPAKVTKERDFLRSAAAYFAELEK